MKFSNNISTSLNKVLKYYQYFGYAPTIVETLRFLDIKTQSKVFNEKLRFFSRNKKIIIRQGRVAFSDKIISNTLDKEKKAKILLQKSKPLLSLFSLITTVRFLGISGSMSMNQSDKRGDIDLFVITQDRYLWSTRFMLLILKKILVFLPFLAADRLCFNLFFSNSHLTVPKIKQNLYVAHEVLQLKVIFDKDESYQNFLQSNFWIKKFFPNVHIILRSQLNNIGSSKKVKEPKLFEHVAKKVQIWWLKRTKYRFKEYDGQLWLLQEDWEEKLRSGRGIPIEQR